MGAVILLHVNGDASTISKPDPLGGQILEGCFKLFHQSACKLSILTRLKIGYGAGQGDGTSCYAMFFFKSSQVTAQIIKEIGF